MTGPPSRLRFAHDSDVPSENRDLIAGGILIAVSSSSRKDSQAMTILIEIAKLDHVDPQGWFVDVFDRIPDYKINRIREQRACNCATNADPRTIG